MAGMDTSRTAQTMALLIGLGSTILFLSGGCGGGGHVGQYNPADYRYSVAPRSPEIRQFPEVNDANDGVAMMRPRIAEPWGGGASGAGQFRPVSVQTGGGAGYPGGGPMLSGGPLGPSMPMMSDEFAAMEQLIFGGDLGEVDENEPFRFSYKDVVNLEVEGYPEFEGDMTVLQDGTVRIPNTYLHPVLLDRTREEASKIIVDALAPYIKGTPRVNLTIVLGRGGFYYVFGEAENQGRFPLGVEPTRLSDAILKANSSPLGKVFDQDDYFQRLQLETEQTAREGYELPKYADLSRVSVITPHRSRPTRRVYNVKAALYQGILNNDPVLRDGQIVFVPSSVDGRIIRAAERIVAPIRALGGAHRSLKSEYDYFTSQ